MTEFEALAMKADTDKLYTIFFTQEEYISRYYQDHIKISTYSSTRNIKGMEGGNYLS